MRSRRSVTIAPMAWSSRSLKFAMALRARVTTGFWPVMAPAGRPPLDDLVVGDRLAEAHVDDDLLSRGTCMGFLKPNSFISAGTTSLLEAHLAAARLGFSPASMVACEAGLLDLVRGHGASLPPSWPWLPWACRPSRRPSVVPLLRQPSWASDRRSVSPRVGLELRESPALAGLAQYVASIRASQLLQNRTFLSPSIRMPTRVGLSHLRADQHARSRGDACPASR